MKITQLETVRVLAFPNLLYVQLRTDEGIVGLGGIAQALKPYVGSTGSGAEVRGNSAIDIALWDIFGKLTGQPIYQLLGGACRDEVAIYNTCAGQNYMRAPRGQAVANWGLPEAMASRRYEDLDGFLNRADELALELLESGISSMKIWPFDPYAERWDGQHIERAEIEAGLLPVRKIRDAVGDRMEIMIEMHGLWALPPALALRGHLSSSQPERQRTGAATRACRAARPQRCGRLERLSRRR